MAISKEDKGDVKAAFGKKVAGVVDKATHDGGHEVPIRRFKGVIADKKTALGALQRSSVPKTYVGDPKGKKMDMAKKIVKGKGRDGSLEHKATGLRNTRALFD